MSYLIVSILKSSAISIFSLPEKVEAIQQILQNVYEP